MGSEITVTKNNFAAEVLQSNVPVLADFWATWCVPCKMVAPILGEIADEYAGRLKVAKINVDESGDLATEYGIVSIPTLMVFKDGKIVKQQVGAASKQAILDLVKAFL
jgi:thioredoxin 1